MSCYISCFSLLHSIHFLLSSVCILCGMGLVISFKEEAYVDLLQPGGGSAPTADTFQSLPSAWLCRAALRSLSQLDTPTVKKKKISENRR